MSGRELDVLAIYECGARRPTSDPESECPDCGEDLESTEALEGISGAIGKGTFCTLDNYKLQIDLTAVLDLGDYTPERAEEVASEKAKRLEEHIARKFSGVVTDVETSLESKDEEGDNV